MPLEGKQWEKSENYKALDSIQDNLPPRQPNQIEQTIEELQKVIDRGGSRMQNQGSYLQKAGSAVHLGSDNQIHLGEPINLNQRNSDLANAESQIQDYRTLDQPTGAFGYSPDVRASKKYYSNQIGHRYEDQVVPAKRQGALDLEEQIRKYEEEMAER